MTDTLDRIIYRQPLAAKLSDGQDNLLALSGELTPNDAAAWRALVTLTPHPAATRAESQAVGIFAGPGRNFLLAAAYQDTDNLTAEYVLIPRRLLQQVAGNIEPLIALVTNSVLADMPADHKIPPHDTPVLLPLTQTQRAESFRALLESVQGDLTRLLRLLGAALHERHLTICGFNGDTRARSRLVQGLMALLPASARADLTFSTHTKNGDAPGALILFADEKPAGERLLADWSSGHYPEDFVLDVPYISLLRDLWHGDAAAFIQTLADMESLAEVLLPGTSLREGLDKLAAQVNLNERVLQGESVDPEIVKTILSSDLPLTPALNQRYSQQLLEHTLDRRDSEAALLVALKMDEDPALNAALNTVLTDHLYSQPDDVYAFVRTRLNDAMEADESWIERLRAAALVSLQVAISDADSETIMSWLRLIAREPASYGLADILRDGIHATQARAHDDGELARYLITLTIKHAPDIIDALLDDTDLLAMIPNNLGLVLREHAGDPLYTLQHRGPELFLVAMARSARAQAADTFTPEVIDQLWKIYTTGQAFNIPAHYLPQTIIDLLTTAGAKWLPGDSLDHLATLILADGRDELFIDFAAHLAEHEALIPLLGVALHQSQRSVDDIITLVGQLASAGHLEQQVIVDVYIALLEAREWRQAALPLVEHLARLIQQNPALEIETDILWRLLDVAMAARSEMVARIAAQQLFIAIEGGDSTNGSNGEGDTLLVDALLRLHENVQWSQQARAHVMKWWREFVHEQPLARLARLDKALEAKKTLVDYRAIVQTSVAFRRMIGNRSMIEFAESINAIYSLLEDISESFDPSPRQPTNFDEDTVRSELDARRDQLSDHQWRILAKNFKELAALIGLMGDHRSRGNLVRQNVDRQLLSGEQQPESAVDAMKWMAGYLDGVQDRGSEEEA